jgi:hypothetical protein
MAGAKIHQGFRLGFPDPNLIDILVHSRRIKRTGGGKCRGYAAIEKADAHLV